MRAQNIYGIGEPSVESEPVTVGLVEDEGEETGMNYFLMSNGLQLFQLPDGHKTAIHEDVFF